MPIELRILTGARAGQSDYFEKAVISIGRHPASDFLLDIKKDLDVSRRHGEIRFTGTGYKLYDKDSTNGTYLNDEQLEPGGNRDIEDGDTIRIGAQGPAVAVVITGIGARNTPVRGLAVGSEPRHVSALGERLHAERPPSAELFDDHSSASQFAHADAFTPPRARTPEPIFVSGEPAADERAFTDEGIVETTAEPHVPNRQPTVERVAIAVKQQTRVLRTAVIAAVLGFGGLAAVIFWVSRRETKSRDAEIQQLLAANEEATRQFQTKLQGMNDTNVTNALQRRLDSLTANARLAHDDNSQAIAQQQLRENHALQQRINAMDLPAVRDANDPAVGLIVAEIGGHQKEATGFTVTPGGLVVTNRHVVTDTANTQATKILVKFANTRDWKHAHLVKLDDNPDVDLALIQIDEPGTYPAVRGIAKSMDIRVGAPIATIGYPLGTDIPMDGPATDFAAKTTLTIGTVSKAVPNLLQIDAFASHGSSGSPVMDEHGHVIGVVWGGPTAGAGRIVFAVPADKIAALLNSVK